MVQDHVAALNTVYDGICANLKKELTTLITAMIENEIHEIITEEFDGAPGMRLGNKFRIISFPTNREIEQLIHLAHRTFAATVAPEEAEV